MAKVNIEQRSNEWFEWRSSSVTGSMIPILLGLSPKTPYQLFCEMTGRKPIDDLSSNPHVRRGIALEDPVREMIERDHKVKFEPLCFEYDQDKRFKASLDGYSEQTKTVLEIKCPADKNYELIEKDIANKTMGELLKSYFVQIQWQMMCSKSSNSSLVVYTEGRKALRVNFERVENAISAAKVVAVKFLDCLESDTPPPLSDKDKTIYGHPPSLDLEKWNQEKNRYLSAYIMEKSLKESKDEYKKYFEELIEDGSERGLFFDGIKLTKVNSSRVDYKKLAEFLAQKSGLVLEEMDLSDFKKSSQSLRITPHKSAVDNFKSNVEKDVVREVENSLSDVSEQQDVFHEVENSLSDASEQQGVVQEVENSSEVSVSKEKFFNVDELNSSFAEKAQKNVFF